MIEELIEERIWNFVTSLIVSTVKGQKFSIPSILAMSVIRDSSSKLCQCVFNKDGSITLAKGNSLAFPIHLSYGFQVEGSSAT